MTIHPQAVVGAKTMLYKFFKSSENDDSDLFMNKEHLESFWKVGVERKVSLFQCLFYKKDKLHSQLLWLPIWQNLYLLYFIRIQLLILFQVPIFECTVDELILTLASELDLYNAEFGMRRVGGHLFTLRNSVAGRVNVQVSVGHQQRDNKRKISLADVVFVLLRDGESLAKNCKLLRSFTVTQLDTKLIIFSQIKAKIIQFIIDVDILVVWNQSTWSSNLSKAIR